MDKLQAEAAEGWAGTGLGRRWELQVQRRVRGSLHSGVWLEGRVPRGAGWTSEGTQRTRRRSGPGQNGS